jgi:hypothetical protein
VPSTFCPILSYNFTAPGVDSDAGGKITSSPSIIKLEFTYFSSFQGVMPSPIFKTFLSITKPGSPQAKIGLFLYQASS